MDSLKVSVFLILNSWKKNKLFLLTLIMGFVSNAILSICIVVGTEELTRYFSLRNNLSKVILIFAVILLMTLISKVNKLFNSKYSYKYIMQLNKNILEQAMTVQYEKVISPEFKTLYKQMEFSLQSQDSVNNMVESIFNMLNQIPLIIVTIIVFVKYASWTISILYLLGLICILYLHYIHMQKDTAFFDELSDINKRLWYYEFLMYNKDDMLDVKTNNLEEALLKRYRENNKHMFSKFKEFYNRIGIFNLIDEYFLVFLNVIALLYSLILLSKSSISIAEFSVIAVSIHQFSIAISTIGESFIDYIRYSNYSKCIYKFLKVEKEEVEADIDADQQEIVKADNISFGYDEKMVLNNVSFNIDKNKVILILGYNGAGKSTLVNNIAKLLLPKSGKLTFNSDSKAGVVFQDFKLISNFTSYENINCSDKVEHDKISKYVDKIGWKFNFDFNKRLGSELDEDNIDLSQGQRQQVAILRAINTNSELLILDEPTASLDIEKERELYDTVSKLKSDKSIILISHRLSAVHISDEIWFVKDGEIIGIGTHKQLIDSCSEYREMYEADKAKYTKILV